MRFTNIHDDGQMPSFVATLDDLVVVVRRAFSSSCCEDRVLVWSFSSVLMVGRLKITLSAMEPKVSSLVWRKGAALRGLVRLEHVIVSCVGDDVVEVLVQMEEYIDEDLN